MGEFHFFNKECFTLFFIIIAIVLIIEIYWKE